MGCGDTGGHSRLLLVEIVAFTIVLAVAAFAAGVRPCPARLAGLALLALSVVGCIRVHLLQQATDGARSRLACRRITFGTKELVDLLQERALKDMERVVEGTRRPQRTLSGLRSAHFTPVQ